VYIYRSYREIKTGVGLQLSWTTHLSWMVMVHKEVNVEIS